MKNKQFVPEMRFAGFSSDWERVPITEVFTLRNGYTPSKAISEYWTNGNIPWFRMEDIREHGRVLADAIQHVTPQAVKGGGLFPAGSLIVTTTATIGEHALLIADSLANQRFTVFQTVNRWGSIEKGYWLYRFYQLGDWCRANTNTGGLAAVNMDALQKYLIDLPEKDERVKIVNFLSNLDNLIDKSEQEVSRLEKLKAAILQKMFPRQGKSIPEVRFNICAEWRCFYLSEIGLWLKGQPLSKNDISLDGSNPCLHYGELFSTSEQVYNIQSYTDIFPQVVSEGKELLFPDSDVTPNGLGRGVAISIPNVILGSGINILRLNDNFVPHCVALAVSRNKQQIIERVTGTTVKHINPTSLSEIKIFLPTDLREQQKISRTFQSIDTIISAKQKKLTKLQHIKASCLSKMFVNAPQ